MRCVIVSDPRTGSSVLRDTLAKHPALCVACWEIGNRAYNHPIQDARKALDLYTVIHMHRHHRTADSPQWDAVIECEDMRVINLTRRSKLEQFASYELSTYTRRHHTWQNAGEWQIRPPQRMQFDHDRYQASCREWIEQERLLRNRFTNAGLPILDIQFEQIADNLSDVLQLCQAFLGVDVIDLQPAFERLPRTDYSEVFDGFPGTVP